MLSQKDMAVVVVGDNIFIHEGDLVGADLATLLSHVNAGELEWRAKDLNVLAAIVDRGIPSLSRHNGFDRSYVSVDRIPRGLHYESLYIIDGRYRDYRLYKVRMGDYAKETLFITTPEYMREAFCNPRFEYPIPAPRNPEGGMYLMSAPYTYEEARTKGVRKDMRYGDIDEISPGQFVSRVCNRKHGRKGRR